MFLIKHDWYSFRAVHDFGKVHAWKKKYIWEDSTKIFCGIYPACGVGLTESPVCWFQRGKHFFFKSVC